MSIHVYIQLFSSHPWINGYHMARTVLKTILADPITAHDFHNGSGGRTLSSIWEITNSKREVQVVYVAVTTSFV